MSQWNSSFVRLISFLVFFFFLHPAQASPAVFSAQGYTDVLCEASPPPSEDEDDDDKPSVVPTAYRNVMSLPLNL